MLQKATLSVPLLITAFMLCGPAAASTTVLLSLKDFPLKDGQYIEKFEIDTWDVGIVAVCHIPGGWIYTAGHGYDPGGILSVTFFGFIEVGTYGSDETLRRIPLVPSNFTWAPATHCP